VPTLSAFSGNGAAAIPPAAAERLKHVGKPARAEAIYAFAVTKPEGPLPYAVPVYLEMLTLTSGYGDQSGFKKIVASGGRISASDCAWPWAGTGSVLTAPALPTFEPQ
jgi:hypothetical protein